MTDAIDTSTFEDTLIANPRKSRQNRTATMDDENNCSDAQLTFLFADVVRELFRIP